MGSKRINHPLAIKKYAIARLEAGDISISDLCAELNVTRRLLKYWLDNQDYWVDNENTLVVKRKVYSEPLKRKIVREIEAGELTIQEAAIKYDYRWLTNINGWIKKYGSGNLQKTPMALNAIKNDAEVSLQEGTKDK